MLRTLTATIWREDEGFVSLCSELILRARAIPWKKHAAIFAKPLSYFLKLPIQMRSRIDSIQRFISHQWRLKLGRLRNLSGQEVCRILMRHGFLQVRQKGSHAIMQLATENSTITVPVPLHSEIRIGTVQSIIRQSGIPRSEFES